MKQSLHIFGALLAGAVFSASLSAQTASYADAAASVDQRLTTAMEAHQTLIAEISEKKIPLSTSVAELEREVAALRTERDRLLKIRDSRTIDLEALKRSVNSLEEQSDFIDSRLNEFVREFEARLNIAERPAYEAMGEKARLAPANVNLSVEERRSLQTAVIDAALGRLDERMGGLAFEGSALNPAGELVSGSFVALGPTVYFAAADGSVSGLVENQVNIDQPVVAPVPSSGDIAKVAKSGSGEIPLDATLGRALLKAKASKSLIEYAEDGGTVGYVIIGLGALALLISLLKVIEILGFRVVPASQIAPILDDIDTGKLDDAKSKSQKLGGATGEMILEGVNHHNEKRSVLEELLFEKVLSARPSLESRLPFLAITAAAAPLLGLLGTVIGMIKTFQLITIFGTGDAKSLSSGISEALVTTALGLIVAIPVLILHGMLLRLAKKKLGMLEQCAVAFVNGLMTRRHAHE